MQELKRRVVPLTALALALGVTTIWGAANGHLIRAVAIDLMVVIAAALVVWPRVRWLAPVVVPLLVAGVLGQFHAQAEVSLAVVVPAALGLVAAVALAAGVDVGRGIDAAVQWAGRVLERLVGAIAFGIVIVPAWAWTRLRRRDVLRPTGTSGPSWAAVSDRAGPASLASSPEVVGAHRTAFGRLTWGVGCVAVLLALNFGAGWVWDQAYPTDPPTPLAAPAPVPDGTDAAPAGADPLPPDPRASLPAMAAYPWRDQYFDDIRRTNSSYWPYAEYRPSDFRSEHVNQRDWIRVSHEPEGDPDTMPVVWMFGGSTTWGEGQRDGYTIPSQLSRIAEEEGVPLQISNYGARGWVHFQEMLLFEQQLAQKPAPDVAVFYDGANEITAQTQLTEASPAHILTYAYAQKLYGATIATEASAPPEADDPSTMDDAIEAYEQHSAVHKLVDLFRSSPAGARPSQEPTTKRDDDLGTGIDGEQTVDEDGTIQGYHETEQDGIDAAEVYERGRDLTLHLSEQHDVDTLMFWQPMAYDIPSMDAARERLTEPTIDISDALDDHRDVFIDGGHTNEEGARIVAERIWADLEPEIRAWYEEHR